MRYVKLEVPSEALTDFVREMQERDLDALIVGLNEDEDIMLQIGYEKHEADKVDELEERLNELLENFYEEEQEEDGDDKSSKR